MIVDFLSNGKSFMPHCSQWCTPQHLFDELNAEFQFDLDVCATEENAKCQKFYSPIDDGLKQAWFGTCWMNPPYGREIEAWIRKAYEEAQRGATVVCLLPVRTDTSWWHDYVLHGEIRFFRKRIHFQNLNGDTGRARFTSVLVIFKPMN